MAEDKKGFVLYCDLIHTIEKLPDDKAGLVFKHLLRYVNDQNPITEDLIVDITFEPIKRQLKRDLIKYEGKKEQWSEAGKASAEARRLKKLNELQQNSTDVKSVSTVSTVTDTVKVTVKDTVKVTNLIEQYFKDFENGSHIVEMARFHKTTVEVLKNFIPYFKLKVNAEYPSYGKFIDHFRNTWLLNKDKINLNKPKGGRVLED